MTRTALIVGATGQDGSYLAELLLAKGYAVHGLVRRASSFNTARVEHLYRDPHDPRPGLRLHYGDLTDAAGLARTIAAVEPHEVYNLGAQSHVQVSFELPSYTADVNALGAVRLLEALRAAGATRTVRYYQASTSELYGNAGAEPLDETTPFAPRSPYGASKLYAYWITVSAREAHGMHASNGILFNHESPRRGPTFVSRKITRGVAAIVQGRAQRLYLGNLEARRDWGHARDYVEGMWRMVARAEPGDYVLATGRAHSVREFAGTAFAAAGVELAWQGRGADEQGVDTATGAVRVAVDPRYLRATEIDVLLGDPAKAHRELGWRPRCTFEALVEEMVAADLAGQGPGGAP